MERAMTARHSASAQNENIEYYNTLPRWGKTLSKSNQQRIEHTLELVPSEVYTVLDVGFGDGTVSNQLVAEGLKVTGADLSIQALKYFEGKGVLASIDRLTFPDRCFDLVVFAEVLEHRGSFGANR